MSFRNMIVIACDGPGCTNQIITYTMDLVAAHAEVVFSNWTTTVEENELTRHYCRKHSQ